MDNSGLSYPELVLSLDQGAGDLRLELRFNDPESATGERIPVVGDAEIVLADLAKLENDAKAYGAALVKALLPDGSKTLEEFRAVRAVVESRTVPLRIRLIISPNAPKEVHSLRWELLGDPDQPAPLFASPRIAFSRFMTSQDWRTVKLRAKTSLRALVAVSSPTDLQQRFGGKLSDIPFDEYASIATDNLKGFAVDALGKDQPVTLDNLITRLRKSEPDVLSLPSHGAYNRGTPMLLFQDDQGLTASVKGDDFANAIGMLNVQPRLVVMASCEGAGAENDGSEPGSEAFHALAPLLARAGVGAVIAMRGKISMDTVKKVMPVFFEELSKDGQVDRSLAVARGAAIAASRKDTWMIALFMRLRQGRIWYEPGFAGDKDSFEQWDSICKWVIKGKCVPILGPDVFESLVGSATDLSSALAGERFPLESKDKYDLAKIGQYLATQHSEQHACDTVREAMQARLTDSAARILGRTISIESVGKELAAAAPDDDPVMIAASIGAKVFVNASGLDVFADYLRQKKKQPSEVKVNWRDERRDDQKEPDLVLEPKPDQPLVYYIFGALPKDEDDEESVNAWVLTEDDFFDFLIRTSRYHLMPKVVSDALVTGSLLFLGFPLDDWKFRVLFRLIRAMGGVQLLSRYNHVAVQVDPAETTLLDARRARKYMEKYFGSNKIDIYWGSATEFLRDLNDHLKQSASQAHA